MAVNPFILYGYESPEYFCDREQETDKILSALNNGRNLTLFSPRRYGKTGLIHHVFHQIRAQEVITIYIDIFGTSDLNEFIETFGQAVVSAIEADQDNFIRRVGEVFKRLRPKVSFDSLTGQPALELDLKTGQEQKQILSEIFQFIASQEKPCYVAIDEFQQINEFAEKNVDGLLRSFIQQIPNASFVFSGSQKHLLLPLFNNPNKPFYQSTEFLHLEKLPAQVYAPFIKEMFARHKKEIDEEALQFILDFTDRHTYYVQFLCNRLFAQVEKQVTETDVRTIISEIFEEREPLFQNYRKLLSKQQFKLLTAIAREKVIYHPTSTAFLKRYQLNSAATVRKSLQSLIDKEMVFEIYRTEKGYRLNDVFLSQWLSWRYEKA